MYVHINLNEMCDEVVFTLDNDNLKKQTPSVSAYPAEAVKYADRISVQG